MNDVQTENLLKTAKNLHLILEDPLAAKVLEVDINAASSQNERLLSRLIRSLEQYVNKQRSVAYIGLVGHYSSGKSSTLNALLELDSTSHQRETGLNPTDKAITLLTHPKNSGFLILMSREEANVPVRTTMIDNDLLRELVIADTPGSGDPHIVNEMIQDFLPICDYLLYFISATNPIDQADLPLLEQKSLKLPFIPVKYIVTRTDEFRLDRSNGVTDENMDTAKKDVFTGRLVSRINQIVKPQQTTPDDFLFIDNVWHYNISLLRDTLVNDVAKLDGQEMVKIHGYKLHYFNENFKVIFDYFLKITEEKIAQSTGYARTASENMARFDKSAAINKEKLKLSWNKNDAQFKESLDSEVVRLDNLKLESFPVLIDQERLIKELLEELNIKVDGQIQGYYGRLMMDVNNSFRTKVREVKYEISDKINQMGLITGNLSQLLPEKIALSADNKSIEVDYSKVDDPMNSLFQKINDLIQFGKNILKSQCTHLITLATDLKLTASLEHEYQNGKSSIKDNFDQYFEQINMYRSTVLSRNNKDAIEKLRIGTQLDELDDDFSEAFIEDMNNEAVNSIFVASNDETTAFTNKMAGFVQLANEIKTRLNAIERIRRDGPIVLGKAEIDVAELVSRITTTREEKLNKIYQEKLNVVLDGHKRVYDEYEQALNQKRSNRNKIIIKWTILSGLVTLGIFLILKYLNVISPSTYTVSILTNIASDVIGSIFGFVYSRIKTDNTKLANRSVKEFTDQQRGYLQQQFGESFWDNITSAVTEESSTQSNMYTVKLNYKTKITGEWNNIVSVGQAVYREVLTEVKNFNTLVIQVAQANKAYYAKFAPVFSNTEKNASVIEHITKRIKEVSIKPSFDLLENITDRLKSVKQQITAVRQIDDNMETQ